MNRQTIAQDLGADCEPSRLDFIEIEPAELDEAKHETEGAAMFIGGLVVVILAACLGLWLSHIMFGPM